MATVFSVPARKQIAELEDTDKPTYEEMIEVISKMKMGRLRA